MISLVIDCEEPTRLADFWRNVVGGVIDDVTRSGDWVAIEGVPGLVYLAFQRVPEPKLVKNRVHLDISVGDLESAIQIAIARGAAAVGSVVEEQTNRFQVMHDPEGNEFCFVSRCLHRLLHSSYQVPGGLMKVGYVVLYVNDEVASLHFWIEQVGMVEKSCSQAGSFSVVQVGFADQDFAFELVPLALMKDNPDGLDLATPSIAFRVDDLAATRAALVSKGVQATELGEHSGMATFAFPDNEGRWFAVIGA